MISWELISISRVLLVEYNWGSRRQLRLLLILLGCCLTITRLVRFRYSVSDDGVECAITRLVWFWYISCCFGRISCKLEWLLGVGISMKEVKFMEYLLEGHFWSCLLQLEVCEVNLLAFYVPLVILSCWYLAFMHMHLFIYISLATAIIECYYYFCYLYNCLRQLYG